MKKHFVIGVVITLLLVIYTSGCIDGETDEEKIIGLWERVNYDLEQTWEFTEDDQVIISGTNGFVFEMIYVFDNGSLFTINNQLDIADKYQYNFDGDDVLILNLVAGATLIDPDTGEIVDLQNSSMETEYTFHRI